MLKLRPNREIRKLRGLKPEEIKELIRPYFDRIYYLRENPDVAAAGIDPLEHYAFTGWRERRDPSDAFSTALHLDRHPRLDRLGINPFLHAIVTRLFPATEFGQADPLDMSLRPNSHERQIFDTYQGRIRRYGQELISERPVLMIAFTNRCGSNLLCEYLETTGQVSAMGEILNAEAARAAIGPTDVEYFTDYLIGIERHLCGDSGRAFGFKASWDQIAMLARWGILDGYPNLKVVHIHREDIIAQAVSFHIALQTGKWASFGDGERGEAVFDFCSVRTLIDNITMGNAAIDVLLNVTGHERMKLSYEALLADPQAAVERALAMIGASPGSAPAATPPRFQRQATGRNAEFRRLFVEEFRRRHGYDQSARYTPHDPRHLVGL